jgi:hypothetical protein
MEKILSTPLSNLDFESYLGIPQDDIISYSELKKFNTIDDLLPEDKSFKIILLEWDRNKGHFVGIMRDGDKYEYFNSLGYKYDKDLFFIDRMVRRMLGQDTAEITRLLGGKTAQWNKTKLQSKNPKIQTCGRWVVFRINLMRMGYSLPEFVEYIKQQKKERGLKNYDEVVCSFIKFGNHKPI